MFIWRSTGNCAGRDRSIDRSILFAAEPTTSRGRETLEGAAAAVESISFSCKSLLIYVVERASERGMCSRLQYNGLLTLASSCLLQATAPLLPHTIYCPLRLAVVKADRGREAGKERALLGAVLGIAVPLRILKF